MKVGVILPSAQGVGTTSTPSYADIRRWALRAEEAGFDSIWIFDHLLVRRAEFHQLGVWEAWTLMSALAEATSRVEIGSWVMSVGFRNPALLAKMAVTLDEVSGGRLILGVGAGNQRGEFEAFGFDFEHRIGRFAEAIPVIAALLRGEHATVDGEHFHIQDCEIDPPGPRPSVPLLIGASGPRMLRLVARYADAWNAHYLGGAEHVAAQRAALDAACAEVGRDPSEITTTVGEVVAFGSLSRPPAAITSFLDVTPDELGDRLHEYEAAGVDHLMLQCFPPDYDEALEKLGVGLALEQSRPVLGSSPLHEPRGAKPGRGGQLTTHHRWLPESPVPLPDRVWGTAAANVTAMVDCVNLICLVHNEQHHLLHVRHLGFEGRVARRPASQRSTTRRPRPTTEFPMLVEHRPQTATIKRVSRASTASRCPVCQPTAPLPLPRKRITADFPPADRQPSARGPRHAGDKVVFPVLACLARGRRRAVHPEGMISEMRGSTACAEPMTLPTPRVTMGRRTASRVHGARAGQA